MMNAVTERKIKLIGHPLRNNRHGRENEPEEDRGNPSL